MQTKELVQYIRKQEKALGVVKAAQKENKTARDENTAKYPEKLSMAVFKDMGAVIAETKRLDAVYKGLRDKETVLDLRIRLAVHSVVALVCESIRDEIKEGGRLCGVSSHYKKFAAVVAEKVAEAGLDGLRAWLDLSYSSTVYLNWEYQGIKKQSDYICAKGLNAIAKLPENPTNPVVYLPENINKVVAEYIREEKACYKLVSDLEKKAQMISARFAYCKRTGIGQIDVLIYGQKYGERV